MNDEAIELEALEHIVSHASAEPMKLSYGLLKSITDNFSCEIGSGGFGVVYKGFLKNGDVAVKKLMNLHALTEKQFLDEIACLKKSKHNNIVRFLGYCSETQGEFSEFNGLNVMAEAQQKCLCFEYVPNGDIKHYLQQEKIPGDDWPLRYQMIRGICQGLHYLHGENINHLDLKPENVMLDANMKPKITDFGLSRRLDQGQSKIITENIRGTLRYIAPETIDNKEISLKCDIYALGIIIIELLTGIDKINLDNWDESLDDTDSPRVRRCTEIARNCTDRDKYNRPTMVDVITDLDELESRIQPRSSVNQDEITTFPWTELCDVYPLELCFMPNPQMYCPLAVTNKTTGGAFYSIKGEYPERYYCFHKFDEYQYLPPGNTTFIEFHRQAVEELQPYTDKLKIHVLITGLDEDETKEKLSSIVSEECMPEDITFTFEQSCGFELHVIELSVVVISEDDRVLVADTLCGEQQQEEEEEEERICLMDVHPTEPWVLVGRSNKRITYIWNWQTNEKMGEYEICYGGNDIGMVAWFVPRKQWVLMGAQDGSIHVRMCPTMHEVKQFRAHRQEVTSLVVHPTRPFLLSSCHSLSVKLWDWNRDWCCTRIFEFDQKILGQVMFNPKHATTFASTHSDGTVQMWRISDQDPIGTVRLDAGNELLTYIGDHHLVALRVAWDIMILDLQKGEPVRRLKIIEATVAMICHPTHPLFVTVSANGFIRVWDSITYRIKRTYVNPRKDTRRIGFTGSRRLVIANTKGITVMEFDLE